MDTSNVTGAEAAQNAQVLIVEDDPTTARYLELSLKRLGCQDVRVAGNSQRALDMMGEQPADLVLMDVDIDGNRDGIETARLLRAEYDVPVIFLTGYNDEITMARAKQVTPTAYLVKPVKAEDLRNTVISALSAHSARVRLADPVTSNPAPVSGVAPPPAIISAAVVDDSDIRRLKSELAAVAVHDADSGLLNRRGLYLLGERELRLAQRLDATMTLLSLSIRNIAAIEIEFGVPARDQARQDVSSILRTNCSCDLLARLEDDTFIALGLGRGRKEWSDAIKGAIASHNETAARAFQLQPEVRVAVCASDSNMTVVQLLAAATEVRPDEIEDRDLGKAAGRSKQRVRR